MHRRKILQLGLGSAAVLFVSGGVFSLLQRHHTGVQVFESAPEALNAIAQAFLDEFLPNADAHRRLSLLAALSRIRGAILALPPHSQRQFSQLMVMMQSAPGRRLLCGLSTEWSNASPSEVKEALERMRNSSVSLRQQAYFALHELVFSAFFADPSAWGQLGYPGPVKI